MQEEIQVEGKKKKVCLFYVEREGDSKCLQLPDGEAPGLEGEVELLIDSHQPDQKSLPHFRIQISLDGQCHLKQKCSKHFYNIQSRSE